MLQIIHGLMFIAALVTAKVGLLDRRAEWLTLPASAMFWLVFAYGSLSVQVVTDGPNVVALEHEALFWMGLAGMVVMMSFFILSITDRLPSPAEVDSGRGVY